MLAIQGTTSMKEISLCVEPVSDFFPLIWLNKWWNTFGVECVDYGPQDVGKKLEIVLSATRTMFINCLNVAPVATCLNVIASFSRESSGCLKIKLKSIVLHLH